MRFAICNPTASLYNNRTQLHAAIEFACLDIIGQKLGIPVHALLGGKLRDTVEFASYPRALTIAAFSTAIKIPKRSRNPPAQRWSCRIEFVLMSRISSPRSL